MKKKIFLFITLCCINVLSFSQVGIGTSSPSNKSALDINSTTRGVLFPRVTSAQRIAIAPTAASAGLKVYDLTTNSYWYWDGTVWVDMSTSTNIGWNRTGNSGTNASTNFIGTTDAVDFVTRTNNVENMRISSAGNVGIGTNSPMTKLHINSSTSPAFRLVDGTQGVSKILSSDANGNASWKPSSSILSFQAMQIPPCQFNSIGSTGSFSVVIAGISTTVTWTILDRQIANDVFPTTAERMQVRYDFSPALPFNPSGMAITGFNNSNYPDVFSINYLAKSQTSLTVNVTRVDIYGNIIQAPCWGGNFFFDVMIVK